MLFSFSFEIEPCFKAVAMEISRTSNVRDLESAVDDVHLFNDCVETFHWNNISVCLPDKELKRDKYLLKGISGEVAAGWFRFPVAYRKRLEGFLLIPSFV